MITKVCKTNVYIIFNITSFINIKHKYIYGIYGIFEENSKGNFN